MAVLTTTVLLFMVVLFMVVLLMVVLLMIVLFMIAPFLIVLFTNVLFMAVLFMPVPFMAVLLTVIPTVVPAAIPVTITLLSCRAYEKIRWKTKEEIQLMHMEFLKQGKTLASWGEAFSPRETTAKMVEASKVYPLIYCDQVAQDKAKPGILRTRHAPFNFTPNGGSVRFRPLPCAYAPWGARVGELVTSGKIPT